MDGFFILQILFDAVLLFGILFLFHYSVNREQNKKEEFDILKNIQVQEMKENLEKLLSTMKQLGKDVSQEIQQKITESEEKAEILEKNIKNLEGQLSLTMELAEEVGVERSRLENKVKMIRSATNRKEKLPSDEKEISPSLAREEKKKSSSPKRGYVVGFSSGIIKQVYKMVDNHSQIHDICRTTKLSKAEIQLILNLRENRFTAPN